MKKHILILSISLFAACKKEDIASPHVGVYDCSVLHTYQVFTDSSSFWRFDTTYAAIQVEKIEKSYNKLKVNGMVVKLADDESFTADNIYGFFYNDTNIYFRTGIHNNNYEFRGVK